MSNLGEKDNSATVDLSKVTVRKPKKCKPKDVTGVDDIINDEHVENVASSILRNHDYIVALFGISLTSLDDINEFALNCEAGKYPIRAEMDKNAKRMVMDALVDLINAFEPVPKANSTTLKPTNEFPIVQDVYATSQVGAAGVRDVQPITDTLFRPLVAEPAFEGVNVSIPRQVVEKVSTRLEHTLYGYFIGNRMAFPVVEYYARYNWGKHGLKRIMMNSKGFFFFKFDTLAGLEAVLEGGPWMIRKSPIILKKWTMDTSVHKEELTRIPVWVKLHDVPLQVFEEDGISLIATFIGKPIMLDSYTSSMCKDSWGRSSFARCLIEINSVTDLVDVVTIGFPSLSGEGFTKATIRVEYEWRPPRCNVCIPKAAPSEPKKCSTSMGKDSISSTMLKSTGTTSKEGNITTSNPYAALVLDDEDNEEHVDNMYDESTNLFHNPH